MIISVEEEVDANGAVTGVTVVSCGLAVGQAQVTVSLIGADPAIRDSLDFEITARFAFVELESIILLY